MLFTTTTQYVALAVALIAGWLFGLASHPGGRKWKQRYADEREAHAVTRKEYDARIAEMQREHEARAADANTRHAEIERENARIGRPAPVNAPTIATRTSRDRAVPIGTRDRSRGWFDFSPRT